MAAIEKNGNILARQICIWIIALALTTFSFAQRTDTTITSVDSLTGVKKIIHYEFIRSGGGYSGEGPHLTKTTITKYDKNGKIIYTSRKTKRLRGCIADIPRWVITATDSTGGYNTLVKRKKKIVVKYFDKNGKLISKAETEWSNLKTLAWLDEDEGTQ